MLQLIGITWGQELYLALSMHKRKKNLEKHLKKSGSWQGIIKTSHLKAGKYYIVIKTEPEINDYDKDDRKIIAHFNWK